MMSFFELQVQLGAAEGVVAPSVSALVWRDGVEVHAHHADRVYDLASLTKPLGAVEIALALVARGRLDVERGHPLLPPGVTIRHLLQHASGWPAWKPFHAVATSRADLVARVLAEPLVAAPGAVHVYSDLGFIALGAVIEAETGERLDALVRGPLRWGDPSSEPTDGSRGGPVHDQNARAMGGIAPHAGLYGSAREVLVAARRWLDASVLPAELVTRAFTERGPGTHTLGWDTPSPGGASTAGPNPPPDAVGHLGFTGTSIWVSPAERLVSILLTNRVATGPDLAPIRALRQAFHAWAWTAR
jgi:serine-type D-Ala-D-Ala carboxypeptidase